MNLRKLITGVLGILVISFAIGTNHSAYADDFEPADNDENASNNLILDADDSGGDISLQFGATLAESLTWDNANTRFNLSDDFVVDGSLGLNGTSLTLDFDEAGNPDQDIDIIASQGSENNGVLRYDDGNNRWEFSNDGTVFQAIPTSGGTTTDLATAQLRETDGDIVNNGAFANIDFNVVDIESDSSTIDADATTDSFTVLADGFYYVSYSFSDDNDAIQSISAQVLLNGATVVNGSTMTAGTHTAITGGDNFSQNFVVQLNTNDSLTLQMSASGAGNNLLAGGVFVITKLDGVTGDAGVGTDNNTFIIDQDNSGGDVAIQFGATLAESLTWDNANTRFNLSDDLRIEGALSQNSNAFTLDADNTGAGADVDIVAEQGTDNNGTLRYSATNNRWEASNDAGNFDAIQTANVFYAYDAAGGQTINATEITMNIDTTVISDSAYTLAADEVTINEDGLYRISFQLGVDDINTAGGARAMIEMTLQDNAADIPGAVLPCYHRETTGNSCNLTILHSMTAGDVLRARLDRINGSTNVQTEPNNSRLMIEKVR